MISAKYRQKEERRKVLKTSLNKLKKIDDPEASLCRSVLINNTMKKLQDEARNEKLQKQLLNYPLSYNKDNCRNLTTDIIKNDVQNTNLSEIQSLLSGDFDNQDSRQTEATDNDCAENVGINNVVEDTLGSNNANFGSNCESSVPDTTESRSRVTSRKRSFSDLDECNAQDVLSHFYVPPTPMLLTGIDDLEDVKVTDDLPKRIKMNSEEQASDPKIIFHVDSALSNYSAENSTNKSVPTQRLRHFSQTESDSNPYGCGHAFMFGEFRNNTYQNLIASLES
ncbi:hypothetical protein JTB14_001203 [Gonioctena quinquepunctata]|nr:hypothetical protein JTB14_001203 [Gonioctena quinquepunctata]